MLTNILKELAAEQMVTSTRGSKGGYRLARPARDISLTDVIDAVEGPMRLTMCCGEHSGDPGGRHADSANGADEHSGHCELEPTCPTKQPLRKVHAMLHAFLGQVSLGDLVSDTVQIRFDLAAAARSNVTCSG
jgi:DNA-binding IscR family transcriptional regulator